MTAIQRDYYKVLQVDPEAHDLEDIRNALVLDERVPVLGIDARSRADAKGTLISLVLHALRGAS